MRRFSGMFCSGGVAGITLAGLTLGSAGVATADDDAPSGPYTATVTGAIGDFRGPQVTTWVFTPCGPDCVALDAQGTTLNRAEEGRWRGTYKLYGSGGEVVECTRTVTPAELRASDLCPVPVDIMVTYDLTKRG